LAPSTGNLSREEVFVEKIEDCGGPPPFGGGGADDRCQNSRSLRGGRSGLLEGYE